MTATTTQASEFIIVGQCQGVGFTLWDIAPAPTDPFRRATVIEELGVDAADAFGSVNTAWGATARDAVDNFVADLREQSGLDDYSLTADSRTDRIGDVGAVRSHATCARGPVDITATVTPGPDSFTVTGAHPYDTRVHERMRSALAGAGITFPAGEVAVRIDDHRGVAETLDLAIVCAILGAAGEVDRHVLDRVVCLGVVGHSGDVYGVFGIAEVVRTAQASGYRTVVVSASKARAVRDLDLGLDVIGVRNIGEAVKYLNRLADN
ncbi:magnesium chelatase domain-containing protein [Streptomyces sp. NPDC012616]|uniref:magnesium chelatase domain-containing protein n=1 Tax=Streptomyces sp. NPDC012616 TaxID=3364840 RepID=UPI0036E95FE0